MIRAIRFASQLDFDIEEKHLNQLFKTHKELKLLVKNAFQMS